MSHRVTDDLTPDERCGEAARILAAGLLRYLRRVRLTPPAAVSESSQNQLDECGQIRLHASTRSAGERTGDAENQGEAGTYE